MMSAGPPLSGQDIETQNVLSVSDERISHDEMNMSGTAEVYLSSLIKEMEGFLFLNKMQVMYKSW